jgi:hypothetical protein
METHNFLLELYGFFDICSISDCKRQRNIRIRMSPTSAGSPGLFLFNVRQHRSKKFSFHLSKIEADFSRLFNNINYDGNVLTEKGWKGLIFYLYE